MQFLKFKAKFQFPSKNNLNRESEKSRMWYAYLYKEYFDVDFEAIQEEKAEKKKKKYYEGFEELWIYVPLTSILKLYTSSCLTIP